jgi:hypothetical protein
MRKQGLKIQLSARQRQYLAVYLIALLVLLILANYTYLRDNVASWLPPIDKAIEQAANNWLTPFLGVGLVIVAIKLIAVPLMVVPGVALLIVATFLLWPSIKKLFGNRVNNTQL